MDDKKISEFQEKLGDKFREVRKKKGVKQEDFYKDYLAQYSEHQFTKNSSIQDYMKKLENGYISCPAHYIPLYAELAEKTVEEFLSDIPIVTASHKTEPSTYPEVYRVLRMLMDRGNIACPYEMKEDSDFSEHILEIRDRIIWHMLVLHNRFKAMLNNKDIEPSLYEQLENALLKNFDDRLLFASEVRQLDAFIHKFGHGDIGDTYRGIIDDDIPDDQDISDISFL